MGNQSSVLRLRSRVTCPRCWHNFPPDECHWISRDPLLLGDPRLGKEQQLRFLPTRFTIDGQAYDAKGMVCNELACPRCHLALPRALLEMEPTFVSILGSPSSGKSYFLAVMTWQLRDILKRYFSLSFGEIEPAFNVILNQYEEMLFFSDKPDQQVTIQKTQLEGAHLYDEVSIANQVVRYTRPFIFSVKPLPGHANHQRLATFSKALCLYDNAGEHFLPGEDTAQAPVTHHLALAQVLLFLFDPTQDPRFRAACAERTGDPQMQGKGKTYRQEKILREAADRVRRYSGLSEKTKHARPLVVIVTKYDAWSSLLPRQELKMESVIYQGSSGNGLNLDALNEVSAKVRRVLDDYAPEIVSAAEGFAEHVVYLPVSALGRSPDVVPNPTDPSTTSLVIRPKDIRPLWVEMPLIYTLCHWSRGLISYVTPRSAPAGNFVRNPTGDGRASAATTEGTKPLKLWKDTGT